MAQIVYSNTHFLRRDELYHTVKPYSLRFTPPEGFPRANIKLEKHEISIHDVRAQKNNLNFKRDGATILELASKMSYDDFDDDELVKDIFLREVSNQLKLFLGAQHVQIFEHTASFTRVRKQHETFPISTGEPYRYNQPTSIAHVDTTANWAVAMAQQLNPERAAEITRHRIQCVNLWKPLVGPIKDWPLALCKSDSIDAETDFEPCDLVYPDYVVENRQVYHHDRQKWFYLSDQMPNEAWVFLQSDTKLNTKPVAHTAFPLPEVTPGTVPPRESIEVRALAYYGGFDGILEGK
ncbi:hypothetical protein NA57DRAFT_82282 [Rhizodiscina lignyota]|uniref:Methyltransferase n=1 Tax=Rhizodiscina lignyota TaxID=1504668 RepID=A0A9P4LZA7_9PEZI|nr:hypothetical protein NA57DRAFT_82282 [Rhizodiscina lignyota]